MGKMHSAVKDKPKDSRFRDWETEAESMRSLCRDADVRSRWDAMIGSLEALEMNRDTYGLVHNDLHYANVLVAGTEVSVVDFDVCNYHFFASDIAIAMQAVLWTEAAGVARDRERWRFVFGNFMRGYRQENSISPECERTIPLFLAYRRLLLFSVFSTEWRDASGWEKARLEVWRKGILNNVAIVPPDWAAMPIEN